MHDSDPTDPAPAITRRRLVVGGAALAAACAVSACSRGERASVATSGTPRRIVALTVGSVDTIARLGRLDALVAVEEDCFVPGTEHLVRIRNDDHSGPSKALNVEAVLALRPDLVIAKEDLRPALGDRGVEVEWIPSTFGVRDVIPFVERIGARLGSADAARALVDDMRARIAEIEKLVAGRPRVRVYYEAGRPGRTVGAGTVIDDMIRLAGGANVAGDGAIANPTLSSEAILVANPEVIVLSPWSETPEEVVLRAGWDRMAAVRDGRVHRVPENDRKFQYPSPSCVDGCASMLVPWFHPDLRAAAR